MNISLLSLILLLSFIVALSSIIYAFKHLDEQNKGDRKNLGQNKQNIKYNSKFLKSVKDLDLNLWLFDKYFY